MADEKWGDDITSLLREFVAIQLNDTNPMVHCDSFSLMESMSAIELMDPKMDQYCSSSLPIENESSSLELIIQAPWENYAEPVTPPTALHLLQSLFIFEVSFLDGASVLETLCQCIFCWEKGWNHLDLQSEHEELHQKFPARGAKNVFEKAILAWCKSLVKGASHVFSIVLTADIYEDEDFVGTYKSYLSDGTLSDDSVVQSLTEAIEAIKLQYNGSDESCSVDQPYADAVVTLLECRIALFNLYRSLDEWVLRSIRFAVASRRAQSNDENDNKSGSKKKGDVMEDISNSDDIAAGLQNLLRIAKHAERAVATIQQDVLDINSALAEFKSWEGQAHLMFAFKPQLVHMIHSGLTRVPTMRSFGDSLAYLGTMCSQIDSCASAVSYAQCLSLTQKKDILSTDKTVKCAGDEVSFEKLLALATQFSSRRIHLLPRCTLYALLAAICQGGSSSAMSSLLQKSMVQRGIPAVLVHNELIAQQWLICNPTSAAWETLRWLCSNRDKLLGRVDNIFSLWGVVGGEGAYVDDQFTYSHNPEDDSNQRWFSVWCIVLVTAVIDVYFSLLAEADLLELDELDYFYWYWDYILSTNSWALNKLKDSKVALEVDVLKLRLQRQQQELHGDKKPQIEDNKKPQIHESEGKKSNKQKSKSKQKRAAERAAASTTSTAASDGLEEPPVPRPLRKPLAVELADLESGPPDLSRLPERDPPSAEEALQRAKSLLCKGLFRGLLMLGDSPSPSPALLDKSEGRYTTREHKFEQRFKPLQCIANPPMLSHRDIVATAAKLLAAAAAANSSSRGFEGSPADFLGSREAPRGGSDDVEEEKEEEEESREARVQRIAAAATGCFQTARKYLDEARKIANALKTSPKEFEATALSYTKVSVASTLSVGKLERKILDHESSSSTSTRSKIRLNRKYSSLFPVIEID